MSLSATIFVIFLKYYRSEMKGKINFPFAFHSLIRTFASDMLIKTKAVVLHALKYGDSRMIVDLFTREAGRLSFIITVPKTQKGRLKKQYFQPMTLLDVESDVRQQAQLQKLRDARLLMPYVTIPLSPEKLALSLFTAEFLYYALRSEQRNVPLFDYISDSMQWLDLAVSGYANFHLTFLMRMSRFLGFYPNLDDDAEGGRGESLVSQTPGRHSGTVGVRYFDLRAATFVPHVPTHTDFLDREESMRIHLLMRMDFPTMHLFRLSRQERNRIVDVLLHYYALHIPQFPELKSLSVLQELWM